MSETDRARRREDQRAVLLLAHGAPDSLDEIPEYLRNVTGGRAVPEAVVEEIRHRYGLIGSSPLTRLTLEQGQLLEEAVGLPVYVGMRNWKPYIGEAVRQMAADGVAAAVVICLAPQNSRTSVGLYRRAAFAEAAGRIRLQFIENWAADPTLARAFAERLLPVWRGASAKAGRPAPVVFTAHSVPCRTVQGHSGGISSPTQAQQSSGADAPLARPDTYPEDAKRTAANVAALLAPAGLAPSGWFFAFQSQGLSGEPWIGPKVEETLAALAAQGHSACVIQPIGFLCDHAEILYDIDIAFRDLGARIGIEITRPPSLNDSPLLIEALAGLTRQGLARLGSAEPVSARSA